MNSAGQRFLAPLFPYFILMGSLFLSGCLGGTDVTVLVNEDSSGPSSSGEDPSGLSLSATSSASITTDDCVSFTVRALNTAGSPVSIQKSLAVSLSSEGTGGAFYTSSTCSVTSTALTIDAGAESATVYYRKTTPGSATLIAGDVVGRMASVSVSISVTVGAPSLLGLALRSGSSASIAADGVATTVLDATLTDSSGNPIPNASIALTIPSNGGSASSPATTNTAGIATFTLTSSTVAGTYNLTARYGSTPTGTRTIIFTPGTATKVVFSTEPSTSNAANAALSTQPVVVVKDANDNIVTNYSGSVSVAIGTNPSAGVLAGSSTVTAVNGVATFSQLWIDQPGNGYTLTASSASLATDTSSAFNVSAATSETGDPYWANVVLMMDMDGTGTSFIDRTGQTVTNSNAATQVAGPTGFGNVAQLSANEKGLSVPASTNWVIGTGAYTAEMKVKFDSLPADGSAFRLLGSIWEGYNTNWVFYVQRSGSDHYLKVYTRSNTVISSSAITLVTGTWYSLAFTADGTNVRFFLNGALVGTTAFSNFETSLAWVSDLKMMIGSGILADYPVLGQIDDVRITKGVARYTSTYTASTSPLPIVVSPPTRLILTGPSGLGTGRCSSAFTVTTKNSVLASAVAATTTLSFAGLGSATVFSDSSCTIPATVTIPSGSSSATFYLKGGTPAESLSITAIDAAASLLPSQALAVSVAADVDPYWSSVILLAKMEGTAGATSFTDSTGRVYTFGGNASISDSQSKFGSTAASMDAGSNTRITTPATADLALGTDDFTVETFVRFNAFVSTALLVGQNYYGADYGWGLYADGSSISFQPGMGISADAAWTPSLNTWYHIAAVRESGVVRIFVNGVQMSLTKSNGASGTSVPMTDNIILRSGPLCMGSLYNYTGGYQLNGYLDEVRVTKGVARYTTGFTTPTASFPNF